jgi:hypothetical protein
MIRRRHHSSELLAVSEAELRRRTAELEDLHHDQSMPAMRSAVQEWIETNHERQAAAGTISRRGLLLGTGAAAIGGVLLAACSSNGSSSGAKALKSSPAAAAALTGDLKVAGLAASLENLGVYAYGAGIKAAQAGKLGSVPPAVVTFATTAMGQHEQHAAAWNAVITNAGKPKVTETDPALTPTVNQMFGQVTDVGGLAKLALLIENIAAQTYQAGIGALSSAKAIATAATIQPVEMQHAAILNLVLGNYPVPNAFNPTSSARPTSDLTA